MSPFFCLKAESTPAVFVLAATCTVELRSLDGDVSFFSGLVWRKVLPVVGLAAWLAAALPVSAVEATLVADAHVNSALPGVNSGAISNLNVGGGYTALLQFDLSMLPAGTTAAQVSRAVLRLYCNRVNTAGVVSLQPVDGAWGEYSVTYSTLPALGSAVETVSVGQAGAFVTVDVTSLVQGWVSAPSTNNGLALTAGAAAVQFDSKENDLTGHAAELDVSLVSGGSVGPAGPAGATGPAGASGPAGETGATGPMGLQGPQGPQGIQGPPGSSAGSVTGLNYQGAYSSSTNYAVDDFVTYQGSTFISLIAGNAGNTPSLSPADWGLLAQGGVGLVGPQGPVGATGPQGLAGPVGPAGSVGPAGTDGAPGAAGSPGLVYRGAYSSTVNYGLGDVVVWQGSSYSSLLAGNVGNTPSDSPAEWGVLTEQGPTGASGAEGPQGVVGPQGLPGSVGPPGEQGPQGLQGIPGQAGAQGLTGPAGAQGLSGPMGPEGPAGPVGMNFRGPYSSSTNYGLADGVTYGGAGYVSLVGGNIGNAPDESPTKWALFASGGAGPAGPQGLQGPQGLMGPSGPQGVAGTAGPAGASGPQGPSVANYTGNYSAVTNYGLHDAVSYGGSTYISLVAGNAGNTPSLSPAQWAVLAAEGPAGSAGVAGADGPQGPAGPAGATGATGPAGPPVSFMGGWLVGTSYSVGSAVSYGGTSYVATIANVGREPDLNPTYWSVLAQGGIAGAPGATGAAGPQGPAGAVGMNYRGVWVSAMGYVANDAVTFGGATYLALTTSLGSEPDVSPVQWGMLAAAGVAGPTGPVGAAAAVSVGTVTTGAPGSQVAVTNSGTASAAVLNFTIPQGAPGVNGTGGGGGGTSGIPFQSMYHAVSFASNYYSVNNGNASASEAQSVLTWVPSGCTATTLTVFSEQSSTITVTLRQGTPGSMVDTELACTVSTRASCTATGSVPVAAGSFVDLSVTGEGGTAAGVWTALSCN